MNYTLFPLWYIAWNDSTVVCMSKWSPASGERVGGCLQSECVSEEQGVY